jgi:hypothetical protein
MLSETQAEEWAAQVKWLNDMEAGGGGVVKPAVTETPTA